MWVPQVCFKIPLFLVTFNNQRLRSTGKTIECQNTLLHHCALRKFHVTAVKTRVIRLRVIEGPNANDQIAFCVFHSFLVEVRMNAGCMHTTQVL